MQRITRALLVSSVPSAALRCTSTSYIRTLAITIVHGKPTQTRTNTRYYSTSPPRIHLQAPSHLNPKETEIFERLVGELEPVELDVQDISGGCGSMYGIQITSEKFRGLNMLKQQRLVNKVLGDEIKNWHGVQLRTKVP